VDDLLVPPPPQFADYREPKWEYDEDREAFDMVDAGHLTDEELAEELQRRECANHRVHRGYF